MACVPMSVLKPVFPSGTTPQRNARFAVDKDKWATPSFVVPETPRPAFRNKKPQTSKRVKFALPAPSLILLRRVRDGGEQNLSGGRHPGSLNSIGGLR